QLPSQLQHHVSEFPELSRDVQLGRDCSSSSSPSALALCVNFSLGAPSLRSTHGEQQHQQCDNSPHLKHPSLTHSSVIVTVVRFAAVAVAVVSEVQCVDTLFIRLSWLFCKIYVLCVHMTELILWVLIFSSSL